MKFLTGVAVVSVVERGYPGGAATAGEMHELRDSAALAQRGRQ